MRTPERMALPVLPELSGPLERTAPLALPGLRAPPDPPGPQARRASPQKAWPAMVLPGPPEPLDPPGPPAPTPQLPQPSPPTPKGLTSMCRPIPVLRSPCRMPRSCPRILLPTRRTPCFR